MAKKKRLLIVKNSEIQELEGNKPKKEKESKKELKKELKKDSKRESKKDSKKVICGKCNKSCTGEVLRVQDKHFHVKCFICKVCNSTLAHGGFFVKDGSYYCASDFQDLFGTKCKACGEYVEGEVVTALGNTYHQHCFVCAQCGKPFPPGDRVTFNGHEVLCEQCYKPPNRTKSPPSPAAPCCAGCNKEIGGGQQLLALDKQWHINCFKCAKCKQILVGEYMGREGVPYCERDYQHLFGIKCANCEGYITGKVLQAGEKHYHPSCSKCGRCGYTFREGEEMYLQGSEIWHPDCGKAFNGIDPRYFTFSPTSIKENARQFNYSRHSRKYQSTPRLSMNSTSPSRLSVSSPSTTMGSPSTPNINQSYLSPTYSGGYAYPRSPTSPEPKAQNFHRPDYVSPEKEFSFSNVPKLQKCPPKNKPRPVSTYTQIFNRRPPGHIDKELSNELVKMSRFPGASKPPPSEVPKIEREDWPGPPATVNRARAKSMTDVDKATEEDERKFQEVVDQEVGKMKSPLGKVILKEKLVEEKHKAEHIDPRNASRTPSADHEPPIKPRYDTSIYAVPLYEPKSAGPRITTMFNFDSPVNPESRRRKAATLPAGGRLPVNENGEFLNNSYNFSYFSKSTDFNDNDAMFDSLQPTSPGRPRPRSYHDEPDSAYNSDYNNRYPISPISPISPDDSYEHRKSSMSDYELRQARIAKGRSLPYIPSAHKPTLAVARVSNVESLEKMQTTKAGKNQTNKGLSVTEKDYSKGMSMPNMYHKGVSMPNVSSSPSGRIIYPVESLFTTNYRLPKDVDRAHLEHHLSREDFLNTFQMSVEDFEELPKWRQQQIKKAVNLF
ncbi:actin-binding LIM protein 2-like isoform X10 [Ptychodera flava]|uniref:actin-binding LIM protein 2-like isoform X10 n=1 Tax=Ptychodera flava TaxID=63121 RepID=UPI00396A7F64